MRISVDAMGGDHAPREVVKGAVEAADNLDGLKHIFLVGNQEQINAELTGLGGDHSKVSVVHASEVVEMGESPAQAVRRKKDSSIGRAVDLVKQGEADAVVSAGNTGAVVVSATLKLRPLPGVIRPTIAAVMPTRKRPVVLTDAGANTDSSPQMIAQFAVMGSIYSQMILGQERPRTGLLSIGSEERKGNEATRETFKLLERSSLNFVGNVEGHDLFVGDTDVIACDGFVGNVVLKTSESAAQAMGHWIKEEFRRTPIRTFGALLLRGAFRDMKQRLDPELYGGAPLLGTKGVCIITHGASSYRAIFHAIRVARDSVHHHLDQLISDEIARLGN